MRRSMPVAAFSAVLLLSSGPLPDVPLFTTLLSERFPRATLSDNAPVDGVIALGGLGIRMIEAVRLARKFPKSKLIITGRGEDPWALYAVQAGIARDRIVLEPKSRNTYENAIFSSRLAHPNKNERWLLVTSAAHMPRAMGVFRKAGFNTLAWPLSPDYDSPESARHEWLGLAAYRLLGRTDVWFPAPQNPNRKDLDMPNVALMGDATRWSAESQSRVLARKSL